MPSSLPILQNSATDLFTTLYRIRLSAGGGGDATGGTAEFVGDDFRQSLFKVRRAFKIDPPTNITTRTTKVMLPMPPAVMSAIIAIAVYRLAAAQSLNLSHFHRVVKRTWLGI
jgi:hypothetical protein